VPEGYEQLLHDMNVFKGNVNLANMLLDSSNPDDLKKEDCPVYDLVQVLKDMEPKLFELIASFMSESLEPILKVCLLVVDDLTATLKRFQQLQNNQQPDLYIPGESYLHTLLHPTVIYERPEEKAFRNSLRHLTQAKDCSQPDIPVDFGLDTSK